MNKQLDFRIPSRLNAPRKLLFMTMDEAVPAILIFLVCFFLLSMPFSGFFFAVTWVGSLKYCKKGKGTDFLMIRLQRLLPFSVFAKVPQRKNQKKWLF